MPDPAKVFAATYKELEDENGRLRRVILEAYWALTLISDGQPRTMDERRAKATRILSPEIARDCTRDETHYPKEDGR